MKHAVTAVLAALALFAHGIEVEIVTNNAATPAPWSAWSELRENGMIECAIAGVDDRCVVMTGEFAKSLFERVKFFEKIARKEWTSQHETAQGRAFWHGKKVRSEVDEETGTLVEEYADGYRYVKEGRKNARRSVPKSVRAPSARREPKLPGNLAEIRKARERAAATTNEVTVTVRGGAR